MPVDLGQLRVSSVIVHEVPFHLATAESGAPVLSDVESPLTQEVRNFFRERIASSLGSAAYEVEVDLAGTSPVPGLVLDRLRGGATEFVAMSQEMARHLYVCQKGNSPEGLLTVCEVQIGTQAGVAILKLEKEQGARVHLAQVAGGQTLSVEHLRDLMLTEKTKVFKVGLFVATGTPPDTLEGSVCDTQKGYGDTIAHFFLGQFLGCRLRELPEVTTKRYFETAEEFFNDAVPEPETRARYQVALLADMNSQRSTVTPRTFVTENLDVADRQPFMARIGGASLPGQSFDKDVTLVRAHLKRVQMAFESGVSVIASPETIGDQVVISDVGNGTTRVQITDKLKRMTGRA